MAAIDFTRATPLTAAQAWARVTAFGDHGRFVPFTTVALIDPNAPAGGGFVARTSLAAFRLPALGFDDVNVLEIWNPPAEDKPGICQLRKTGRLVRGWAKITVESTAHGCSVRWQETITVWGVPRLADPVVAITSRTLFGRVLDGLIR